MSSNVTICQNYSETTYIYQLWHVLVKFIKIWLKLCYITGFTGNVQKQLQKRHFYGILCNKCESHENSAFCEKIKQKRHNMTKTRKSTVFCQNVHKTCILRENTLFGRKTKSIEQNLTNFHVMCKNIHENWTMVENMLFCRKMIKKQRITRKTAILT